MFNSLDAQREACAAYILSQKHEGWTTLTRGYDDGGFSGGSINPPPACGSCWPTWRPAASMSWWSTRSTG